MNQMNNVKVGKNAKPLNIRESEGRLQTVEIGAGTRARDVLARLHV